ncbi:MAG: GFA family protein [Actinobacteria bacterium]|nr:GFA family protein [Actinomycetota bacterium]
MAEMTGSCLCGSVQFEVTEPFERIAACHCETCKKLSGGAGTVNGRVRTGAIRLLAGEDLVKSFQPSEGSMKTFCSECGSNLFGAGWPKSESTSVRLSALDEPYEGKIGSHIFVRSLAPWEVLPDDGAERFDVRGP